MADNTAIGFCRFCGNSRMVQVDGDPDEYTPEELNHLAALQCTCAGSIDWKEQTGRKEEMIRNINSTMGEQWPQVAQLLIEAIDLIQQNFLKRITVQIDTIYTVKLQRQGEGLKLEIQDKRKTEVTS